MQQIKLDGVSAHKHMMNQLLQMQADHDHIREQAVAAQQYMQRQTQLQEIAAAAATFEDEKQSCLKALDAGATGEHKRFTGRIKGFYEMADGGG